MVNITAALVKDLRERTGAGIMECKKALVEANGGIELAIDNMRIAGLAKAIQKSSRAAAEGMILIKISQNGKYGVIVELNCETDFVAKDGDFKAFGNEVVSVALYERITDVEELKAKFEDQRTTLVAKMGENINIRRLDMLSGDVLGSYLHGTRIGVIVSASGADKNFLKHIAMHIAASKPEYLNSDDIPSDIVAREHQIQFDIAMQSGKTPEIAEKMVEGRIRKFTNEIALRGQYFVMDPSKTVGQLLDEQRVILKGFFRFEVGDGIYKTKLDFATEVAAIGKKFQ